MVARRFEIHGRVQGVGFRAYVLTLASRLDLTGEVWNRRDGGVELVAYADTPETLAELESLLRHGPGRVDRVIVGPADCDDVPVDFRVSFTR